MATIKDIARAAGVSHATVSNVLNQKGNVSAQKIKLVMDAARAMGYRINEAAASLRSGESRTLFVIMPDTKSSAYADLYQSLSQSAAENGYGILLRLTGNVPANEHRAIQDALSSRAKCAVIITSLTDPAKAYAPLAGEGTRVLFALRGAPDGFAEAGFDMCAAARDIAARVLADGAHSVGLMTSMTLYSPEAAFKNALFAELEGKASPVVSVQSISSQYVKQAFALLEEHDLDAVVTTNEQMAQAVLQAADFLGCAPQVYTLAPKRILSAPRCHCYSLDFRQLGTEIARSLISENELPSTMILRGRMPGFSALPAPALHKGSELTLLSTDTPAVQALLRLQRRLRQDTGISLSVTTLPTQEVTKAFSQPDITRSFDLARMDMSLMGRLGRLLFCPLEETSFDLRECLPRLLPGMEPEYSLSGGVHCALPFDPSCHLLFFREDLMNDPHCQREFYETNREALEVPQTHESYLIAAQFFDQIGYQAGGTRRGALITRRSSEYISDLVSHSEDGKWPYLTYDTVSALVARKRELERVSVIIEDGRWNSAVRRFAQGESAMMIAHANYAGILADEPLSRVSGHVGYALAPGGRPLLGGGVIGIMKNSIHREEAAVFLNWLFSQGIGSLMALLCGCSPLASAYEEEEVLDIYPWLKTVRTGISRGIRRSIFPEAYASFDQLSAEKAISLECERAMRGEISICEATDRINALRLYR